MQFSCTVNELDHAFYSINMVNNFPGSVCAPLSAPSERSSTNSCSSNTTRLLTRHSSLTSLTLRSSRHSLNSEALPTQRTLHWPSLISVQKRYMHVHVHVYCLIHALIYMPHACHFGIDENFCWTKILPYLLHYRNVQWKKFTHAVEVAIGLANKAKFFSR